MAASISLTRLSWSTPDGTPLFTDLDLNFTPERCGLVGRNGVGKTTLLRLIAGELTLHSGQIRSNGRIALLRQQAMTHPADTLADLFGVRAGLALLDLAAAGRADAEQLAEADWTLPARIEAALLRCGLAAPIETRLARLSGGQRSRAALAATLIAEPDFLLLDEPTNNLDSAGRQAVLTLLQGWDGGLIVVSHDRELLEGMDTIVELSSLGARRHGGNYSAYRARKDAELALAAQDLARAERLRSETAQRAQQAQERKARKDGAGKRDRARGGAPKILLDAAKAQAEASSGAGARLREARGAAAEAAVAAARARIEILSPLQMALPSTGLAAGKTVLRLEGVTGGYAGQPPIIRDVSLTITGPERLVIAGANGSGKSTLLKLITGQLAAQHGRVDLAVPYAMLDQHLGLLAPEQTLHANLLRLNPAMDGHGAHAALARFGFRAADGLRLVGRLSGGERLRAGLAATLGATPSPALLILDEPTNHLDLDGITALEAVLSGYDGAVLVVSHDTGFVAALGAERTLRLA